MPQWPFPEKRPAISIGHNIYIYQFPKMLTSLPDYLGGVRLGAKVDFVLPFNRFCLFIHN